MNKETIERKGDASSRFQGFQLLLVQSCVCLFAALILVALRFVSEDAFSELSASFQSAMIHEHVVYAGAYSAPSGVYHESKMPVFSDEKEEICAPLQGGVITSSFGERTDPFDETKTVFHQGIDIAADNHTPLHAMLSGQVLYVRNEPNGYGNYLAVSYEDGSRYVFAHCSSIIVQPGQSVNKGDVIAYVGNSGRSTGNHVHIEWIVNETAVDPMVVLPETTYV